MGEDVEAIQENRQEQISIDLQCLNVYGWTGMDLDRLLLPQVTSETGSTKTTVNAKKPGTRADQGEEEICAT